MLIVFHIATFKSSFGFDQVKPRTLHEHGTVSHEMKMATVQSVLCTVPAAALGLLT